MNKPPLLILGATSPIARAAAAAFAREGHPLFLAGRDEEELHRIACDLSIRHRVRADSGYFDACDIASHPAFFAEVENKSGAIGGLLLAFGKLGDQQAAAQDFTAAEEIIRSNYTGACSILTCAAAAMAKRKGGFIVVVGSVAGDRGRQSNYVYGSAKGGLALFVEGLRNRLHPCGVRVVTVKPGFVDTPMTYGMEGLFCVADPRHVGERIAKAAKRGRTTIYVPGFWRWIMALIKLVPEPLFKRLKL